MEQGKAGPDEARSTDNRPTDLRKLTLGLCLFAITTYWTVNSYQNQGGVLHGARWMLSLSNLRNWFGFGSQDIIFVGDECTLGYEEPLEAARTIFGGRCTIVYGWPSTGGVWVHHDCYGVELEFLGLSRFERSPTQRYSTEEDDFCKRLELIGGLFFENESIYDKQCFRSTRALPHVWYGWPGAITEGGVWALQTKHDEDADKGVSRIRNALTMEERCKAIEMLGGQFYQTWKDAPKADPHDR